MLVFQDDIYLEILTHILLTINFRKLGTTYPNLSKINKRTPKAGQRNGMYRYRSDIVWVRPNSVVYGTKQNISNRIEKEQN